jgi:hypothetical protein
MSYRSSRNTASAARISRAWLTRSQVRARSDAKLAAFVLVLMILLAPLSAMGALAFYPIALGETGASAARVADASVLCNILLALALGGALGIVAFAALLIEAIRRF